MKRESLERDKPHAGETQGKLSPIARAFTAYAIIIGYVILGFLIGYLADKYFNTPLGYIIGSVLGLVGIVFSLLRFAK